MLEEGVISVSSNDLKISRYEMQLFHCSLSHFMLYRCDSVMLLLTLNMYKLCNFINVKRKSHILVILRPCYLQNMFDVIQCLDHLHLK